MKKILTVGLALLLIVSVTSCSGVKKMDETNGFYKEFNKVKTYITNIPDNYQYTDYHTIAKLYDEIAFDFNAEGEYLPLIWEDKTYDSFGISAYVGDGRTGKDGQQEAITAIAAVLSASLNGIDKSNQDGKDYVRMLNAFFSKEEGILLNNPDGSSSTTSMWYLLYPAILYTEVSMIYEDQAEMRQNSLKTIENWYKAYEIMRDQEQPDYDYTGFDFKTWLPYQNDIWTEPDCSVGMAVLFYYGYSITGNQEYLTAAISLMDYIESYFGGPLYEVLMYYAPALMAELNTLYGTEYNITKSLDRIFDGNSIPRGGWGSLKGTWGKYEIDGLFGSATDGGGYAFAMNTFAASGAVVPLVRYDARYARSIGEWILHVNSNARYFFSQETVQENQSVTSAPGIEHISEAILQAVPYEGIRKQSNGKSPWFGGDPTVYGWAETDFSLYSGAHTGILGALFEETDEEGILKVDLLATEVNNTNAYPTYLIYNPHKDDRQVTYRVKGEEEVDLFDTVTNTIVASQVKKDTIVTIPADGAVVVVEIPTGKTISHEGLNYYVEGIYISSDRSTLSLDGPEYNAKVSGKFELKAVLSSNFEDEIEQVTLTIDDESYQFTDHIKIDVNNFSKGTKQLQVNAVMKSGITEEVTLRLIFE